MPILTFGVSPPPQREPQIPFISGDAFRYYADYVFDELDSSLHPASIHPHSTIFVKTDMLGLFFEKVHPHIPCRYILITHNSDAPCPGSYVNYLEDEKLIAWFGQNYDGFPHPKMHPIPIGIANYSWPHGNGSILKMIREKTLPRVHLAFMNIAYHTYPQERWGVFKHFCHQDYCFRAKSQPFIEFLSDLASSKFCVSPRGNGLDTHRIWESLYLGTIPIVKSSSLDCLYRELPILIVSNWKMVNQEFLEQKYEEMKDEPYNLDKIYSDYWFRLIDSYK